MLHKWICIAVSLLSGLGALVLPSHRTRTSSMLPDLEHPSCNASTRAILPALLAWDCADTPYKSSRKLSNTAAEPGPVPPSVFDRSCVFASALPLAAAAAAWKPFAAVAARLFTKLSVRARRP